MELHVVLVTVRYRNGSIKEVAIRGYNRARDYMVKLLRDDATVYSCDFAA